MNPATPSTEPQRGTALPAYFLSHGGGPWPWMQAELGTTYAQLEASIIDIRRQLGRRPRAIVLVTGHWIAPVFTLSAAPAPGMLYDYGGFPPHTYRVRYPAPGEPALAAEIAAALQGEQLAAALDTERGFDHGTFTVLQVLYPEADIPVVQMSIRADFDPAAHIAAGRALAGLRERDVLVIGSGLSFHNLRLLNRLGREPSRLFDTWLHAALTGATGAERGARLARWAAAPAARTAHPAEDHLLPLLVAHGAALAEPAQRVYHEADFMGYVSCSSYRFGNA